MTAMIVKEVREAQETITKSRVEKKTVFEAKDLNLWYGEDQALKNIHIAIAENNVTAIIGPSGCGKSTFVKSLNRMVDLIPSVRMTGQLLYRGENILDRKYGVEELRTKVGMVFQKPNPFPKSIYENVVYGPVIHGIRDKKMLREIAEKSLKGAALWDEVKNRLHKTPMVFPADSSSGFALPGAWPLNRM